jgi:hypothetical protein
MTPYKVLDTYHPTAWKAWKVGRDLTTLTKKHGLAPHPDPIHGPLLTVPWVSEELHAEVRKRTFKTKQAEDWHFDGDITPGANPHCCLVLWTTNTPTEIMYQGKIYTPNPYEVIIFKNLSVKHRRPPNCPRIRWIFRMRTQIPTHIDLP